MANVNDIKNLYLCGTQIKALYLGDDKLWPTVIPVGTVYNFDYTGTVQSVRLSPGRYKLQCWGAQGGSPSLYNNSIGTTGGYSEGIITLTETTKLYVFVGGKGSNGSSEALVNGGWNGGGGSIGKSSYINGTLEGSSYPTSGGGATDICTITSSMDYQDGRTNRSNESLLSRIIVAGGGGGISSCQYTVTETTITTLNEKLGTEIDTTTYNSSTGTHYSYLGGKNFSSFYDLKPGHTYTLKNITNAEYITEIRFIMVILGNTTYFYDSITLPSDNTPNQLSICIFWNTNSNQTFDVSADLYDITEESTTTSETTTYKSYISMCGGGISGGGSKPGTLSSAGTAGSFGLGATQTRNTTLIVSGGGGGGWYGGGIGSTNSNVSSYLSINGGGSGFVNIAENAQYRPEGYTGLQLDSGTTIAGNTSHPSTNGGTETGHRGNGYARITAIGDILGYEMIPYVEFTGNQYVNTGFIPSNTTKLWMDFEIPTPVIGNVYYGSRDTTSSNSFLFAYSSINNKLRTQFGSQVLDYDATIQGRHEITHDKNVVTLDGVTKTHNVATFKASKPLYLGAENRKGTVYFMSTFRIYGCKIYDNDVLVRDFVPTKNGDGIVGLYDRVTDTFYTSGTGTDLISS